jgi:polar amino acid transport system permease protein
MTLPHLWAMLLVLLFGYPLSPEMADPRFPLVLQRVGGLLLSVLITVLSLIIGGSIGAILALCQREGSEAIRRGTIVRLLIRALRGTARGLVIGVRSLPIMLLVLVIFYLPYPLSGLRLPSFALALASFSLYASVYLCEIIRAGLRSLDPQLRDVGKVLGLRPAQILLRIELPLVCRVMMPDIINVAITVFKDTSALSVVAFPELTYTARQMLMAEPLNYGLVLLVILALYWTPATLLSALVFQRASSGTGGQTTNAASEPSDLAV